jgi:hypothetical protein
MKKERTKPSGWKTRGRDWGIEGGVVPGKRAAQLLKQLSTSFSQTRRSFQVRRPYTGPYMAKNGWRDAMTREGGLNAQSRDVATQGRS